MMSVRVGVSVGVSVERSRQVGEWVYGQEGMAQRWVGVGKKKCKKEMEMKRILFVCFVI